MSCGAAKGPPPTRTARPTRMLKRLPRRVTPRYPVGLLAERISRTPSYSVGSASAPGCMACVAAVLGRGRPAAPALARGGGPLGWFWLKRHWAAARPGRTCRRMLPGTRRRGGTSCLSLWSHLAVEDSIIVFHQSARSSKSEVSGSYPHETKSRALVAGAPRTSRPSQRTHAGVISPLFSRVAKALHTAMH